MRDAQQPHSSTATIQPTPIQAHHHAPSKRTHTTYSSNIPSPSSSYHTKAFNRPSLPWHTMSETIVMLEAGGRINLTISPHTSTFNPSLIGTSMYDIINETERIALRDAIDEAATTKLPAERTAVSNYDETVDANLQWITYKVHPIVQYAGRTNEKGEPDTFATNFMVTRTDSTEKRVTDAIRTVEEARPGVGCIIWILDPVTHFLQVGAAPSFPKNFIESLPVLGFPAGGFTFTKQISVSTIVSRDTPAITPSRSIDILSQLGFRARSLFPIYSAKTDTPFGALSIYFKHDRGPSPLDNQLLVEMAALAGFAITLRKDEENFRRVCEARFHGVDVANDQDLTLVVDAQGIASFVSPVTRKVLRIGAEEDIRNMDIVETFVVDKDKEKLREYIDHAKETPGVATTVHCIRFKPRSRDNDEVDQESNIIYVELKVKGLWKVPGVSGCLIHGRDVTSRVAAHKEMLTSQESLSVTLNSLNEGVIRTDENGIIEQINFAFLKLLDPQLASEPPRRNSRPRSTESNFTADGMVDGIHSQAFGLVDWLGKPVSMLLKIIQVFMPDGNTLQHLTGMEPSTPRGDFGPGWTHSLSPSEEESKQISDYPMVKPPNEELRYRAVYANISEMIACALQTHDEVSLRDMADLPWQQALDETELLREDIEWILEHHLEDPEHGRNIGYLVRTGNKPTLLPVEISVSPLRQFVDGLGTALSETPAKGTVIVVRDSSEITKARLANKKLANKSRWISVITHEMRTPVHGIIESLLARLLVHEKPTGMLDLLRKTNLGQEQRGLVNCMEVSANALICLVSNVLDQSRLEAGKVTLEMVPFNMKERLKSFVDLMTMMAKTKHVSFMADIDPEIPEILFSDFNRLFQILLNLISNAMKFCSRGHKAQKNGGVKLTARVINDLSKPLSKTVSPSLRPKTMSTQETLMEKINNSEALNLPIKSEAQMLDVTDIVNPFTASDFGSRMPSPSASQIQLLFEIEDNGIGISKQNQSKLFKEFGQAEESTTRRFGGSGMGLYICKQLVELFGGTIGCESELGVGSRFYFTAWFQRGESVNTPSSETKEFFVEERAMMVNKAYGDTGVDSGLDVEEGLSAGDTASGSESGSEELSKNQNGLEANKQARNSEEQAGAKERITKDKIKVLVADDDMINQQVLAKFLEGLGYKHVDVVGNGRAAVDKCRKRNYNFVLMDLFMPVMDGLEAAAVIKANCIASPEPRPLPTIIAITGDDNVNPRNYIHTGVRSHLTKPVRMQVLKAELEKYIEIVD
ncbi:hypothetical protein BC937DRAFT_88908 [Endogone sp. FLAS-F59071]|nr:hypothetical protein BC937DRAFT_88908 [Endogone sp. FLAS-F59071]|eukprot:RUS18340.1 hypothetical protein BC937DRAFT_88908 [Endogone sp. FLAS-F59071]